MKHLRTRKGVLSTIILTVFLAVAIPATALGQGRGHGKGHGNSRGHNQTWHTSNNKKCGKFVNCHDARDGRWDGRGPRGDRVGNSTRHPRYRTRTTNRWLQRRARLLNQ